MQRKLLTTGNVFRRTDERWGGVVWFLDENGERCRKSFSGTTKSSVSKKITEYIDSFNREVVATCDSSMTLRSSMQRWLEVFKFPSIERTCYDRCECTAKHQIYPLLGKKSVGDITTSDIRNLLTDEMNSGYAYTTVKKAYGYRTYGGDYSHAPLYT